MQALSALWAWCLAHPLIVWPVATFVVTAIFGEADQYAKTHPGFARVLALLNAAGLSAPGLLKVLKGKLVPPAVTVVMVVSVMCAAPLFVACPTATPVVGPSVNLVQCVTTDALAGKSIGQIVADCGSDVPSVIVAIINAVDPGVLASRAHAEALNVRMALIANQDAGSAPVQGPGK